MKRKNDYNNLVLSTKRNKKLNDIKRIKALNSIDINEYATNLDKKELKSISKWTKIIFQISKKNFL